MPETPATEHSTPAAATVTEAAGLNYLDPQAVRLTRAGARIDAVVEGGAPVTNVQLYRAFPLTDPERYLSLRNEKNEELGLVVEP